MRSSHSPRDIPSAPVSASFIGATTASGLFAKHAVAIGATGIVFGGLLLSGIIRSARRGQLGLFLAVILVTIASATAVTAFNIKVFNVRYLMCAFPLYIALLAYGLPVGEARASHRRRRRMRVHARFGRNYYFRSGVCAGERAGRRRGSHEERGGRGSHLRAGRRGGIRPLLPGAEQRYVSSIRPVSGRASSMRRLPAASPRIRAYGICEAEAGTRIPAISSCDPCARAGRSR